MKKIAVLSIFLGVLFLAIAGVYLSYGSPVQNEVTDEHCIVYGSVEHQMRFASDYPLAKKIVESGMELGPYFDYNFCEGSVESYRYSKVQTAPNEQTTYVNGEEV